MQKLTQFLDKYKFILISVLVAIVVLAVAFIAGGSIPDTNKTTTNRAQSISSETIIEDNSTEATQTTTENTEKDTSTQNKTQPTTKTQTTTSPQVTIKPQSTQKPTSANPTETQKQDKYHTDPTPSDKPKPVEPQEQTVSEDKLECTISISCSTILSNMEKLSKEKAFLVPDDGWILPPEKVTINEGESVLDLLVRVCKEKKIHLEYTFDPFFNSDYIEGINNLYEFDCGEASGWMYCVNGWFPNYGVSRYVLKKGDNVEFKYTCNGYGEDIGAGFGG